ncbi:MAG TPA: pyrroline-5-carboxylate reductase [Armatimonadota bacterium]|nr:pyrroline-5-carboxylate reductase [Armatimonadota bacterium]
MNLTIIGAGKMGEALSRGILKAGLVAPANFTITDVATDRVKALAAELGATAAPDNTTAVREASVIILAVKPNIIPSVCGEIASSLAPGTIVVSIAAGITIAQLENALAREDIIIARVMPNTPCLVGAGAIAVSFAHGASTEARQTVLELLGATGVVEEMPERLLDAVTGLSGSGPAYVAVFIEALADGGVLMGLPRAQAQELAIQTVLGTAQLIQATKQHPAQVKDAVSSPGGTTIAGVAALEDAGFRAAAIAAVKAATVRSRELSRE